MSLVAKRILAIIPASAHDGFNTSVQRIEALERLGYDVEVFDSYSPHRSDSAKLFYAICNRLFQKGLPVPLPGQALLNSELQNKSHDGPWDIFWFDKANHISERTISFIKQSNPDASLVGYSPDDMFMRCSQSQQFLDHLHSYDVFFTTKTYNVEELESLGCRKALFIGNGYDPVWHRPHDLDSDDIVSFGSDVGFMGRYESQRFDSICFLAQHGINVRAWGWGWEGVESPFGNLTIEVKPLYRNDYAKACCATKINLGFLSKITRDQQTTRTVEIPACGGFLLAERTDEHLDLFKEGVEAEFFSNDEEMLDKCKYYLKNEALRQKIASAGRQRCLESGYSNDELLKQALGAVT